MREVKKCGKVDVWNKITPYKQKYRCYEDCVMSGCPQHEATFAYHSVSDTFEITFMDGRKHFCFDGAELDMIKQFINILEEK